LVQGGYPDRALEVLGLFAPVVERQWPPASRARFEVLRGDVLWRLDRRAEAVSSFRGAVVLDPTNTNAKVWLQAATRAP
jgi:predicted negative regulator of RcsB-dependent stress response